LGADETNVALTEKILTTLGLDIEKLNIEIFRNCQLYVKKEKQDSNITQQYYSLELMTNWSSLIKHIYTGFTYDLSKSTYQSL